MYSTLLIFIAVITVITVIYFSYYTVWAYSLECCCVCRVGWNSLFQPTLQTQQHSNIIRTQSCSASAHNLSSDTEYALAWHWSRGQTQKFLINPLIIND